METAAATFGFITIESDRTAAAAAAAADDDDDDASVSVRAELLTSIELLAATLHMHAVFLYTAEYPAAVPLITFINYVSRCQPASLSVVSHLG